jgi:hypothetical protein
MPKSGWAHVHPAHPLSPPLPHIPPPRMPFEIIWQCSYHCCELGEQYLTLERTKIYVYGILPIITN